MFRKNFASSDGSSLAEIVCQRAAFDTYFQNKMTFSQKLD